MKTSSVLAPVPVILLATAMLSPTALAAPSSFVESAISRLKSDTAGSTQVSVDSGSEVVSFVRLEAGPQQQKAAATASFDRQARAFLNEYGAAFGLKDPDVELEFIRQSSDAYGLGRVRYRQVFQGIPVFGAELSGQFNSRRQLSSVSASTLEIGHLNATPSWSASAAEPIAIERVRRAQVVKKPTTQLSAVNSDLMIFRTGYLQGVAGRNHLAWRVEVANDSVSIREFVFIDAHSGKVLDQITGIHTALDRKVSESSLANVVWQDSNADPDPITPGWASGSAAQRSAWQDEIDGARETYNLFASMTAGAWLSYDSADATMRTVNNDPQIACPNANWNGESTNYCNNVTGDDTVAHEWGHAYTDYTANLIYQWQSGALNESFSDVWGEVVDFLNGRGTDAPITLRTAGSCSVYGQGSDDDDSYRWLSGEDDSAFGGAIRDMWNPTCYNDPGKVTDNIYWCSTADSGGVHINSGVPNHAFALMVDGGIFNGQDITGLGLLKSSHIFWNALQMLVPASDFPQMANALEASCSSLVGIDLPDLSTSTTNAGASGVMISQNDCFEVTKAVAAVELRTAPVQCNFQPLLNPNVPERCEGLGDLQSISLTDWESGLAGWTASTRSVTNPGTFDTPDWAVVSDLPNERSGSAAFVADLVTGDCISDDETGALALDSPPIVLPIGIVPRISINHWVATEFGWDGGNLKVSVNDGPFETVSSAEIEVNSYNTLLNTLGVGNTNPLAGEAAFSGTDGGSATGSWGQSQANLSARANPGDTIRLRLDFGVDGCNGVAGWYVDEVELYSCTDETATSLCGNGEPDGIEQCDDGNQDNGDGCSSICELELGWECTAAIAPSTIPDYSFEGGGIWTESSTNYGTPLCTEAECGLGTGTGPSDGITWAWFGGVAGQDVFEQGSMAQTLTIADNVNELTFDMEIPACDSASDFLELRIDDNTEFRVDGSNSACGVIGYQLQQVDISAYADGEMHSLEFFSETFGVNADASNFFVDRVLLSGKASVCLMVDDDVLFINGFEN